MRVRGRLYSSGSSERIEAVFGREGDRFLLIDSQGETEVAVAGAGDRLPGVPQSITLRDGRRFVPFAQLPPGFVDGVESRAARRIALLERFSPVKAVALVVLIVLGVLGLRAAVPFAADLAVVLIPERLEAEAGRQAFDSMDALLFRPSAVPPDRRRRVADAARVLARRNGVDPIPEIHFRGAPTLGANAFAFPGGPVMVTDDLADLLGDDELLAVIAHEFAHVEERHGLRQALRAGGLVLVVSMVAVGDASLIEELAALAVATARFGHSRRFERDADALAARFLETAGRRSDDLARALTALQRACGNACDGGWFSTHPATASRVDALRSKGGRR